MKNAKQILITARQNEVAEYEFNLKNYEIMLDLVGDDAELSGFKSHLHELVNSTKVELKKARIILQATLMNELELPGDENV